MLEKKDYKSLDSVFFFIAAFIARHTCYNGSAFVPNAQEYAEKLSVN